MKTKSLCFVCSLLLFNVVLVRAQYNAINLKLESSEKKYIYQNLQLYPIRANRSFVASFRNMGKYNSLQQALEKKKVVISEFGSDESGNAVNTLFIENTSADTVIVLAGEVVQGGKQDRMIAQDFMLYPHSGKKDVAVYCVEHGRWQPKDGDLSFKNYYAISSNKVRKAAAVSKNQQEVWDNVAITTEKNSAGTRTGTLTALKESDSFNKTLASYTTYLGPLLLKEDDVIGFIAVSGDSILGCDMFATHELFTANYVNLLNSYVTEAITSGGTVNVTYDSVQKYLHEIIDNERDQDKQVEKKGTMLKDGKRKIHISTF